MKRNVSKNSRSQKYEGTRDSDHFQNIVLISSTFLEEIPETQSLWYETPEEIEQKLQWGKEKAHLLEWVQKQMERKLTIKEKRYIEYYYFQGETLETIARKFNTHPANIHRTIRRGIKKLIYLTRNENIRFRAHRMKRVKKLPKKQNE
jgi:DNA-directed RNA polymerase specialized sigma subunit